MDEENDLVIVNKPTDENTTNLNDAPETDKHAKRNHVEDPQNASETTSIDYHDLSMAQIIAASAESVLALEQLQDMDIVSDLQSMTPVSVATGPLAKLRKVFSGKFATNNNHETTFHLPAAPSADDNEPKVFGAKLSDLPTIQTGKLTIPEVFHRLSQAIRTLGEGLNTDGLFRKSGSSNRKNALREMMDRGSKDIVFDEEPTVLDYADLFKAFFREMPEPVMPSHLLPIFSSISKVEDKALQLVFLRHWALLIPQAQRDLLQSLSLFLNEVSLCNKRNQMTVANLAKVFVPNVCNANTTDPLVFGRLFALFEVLIEQPVEVFAVPPQLVRKLQSSINLKENVPLTPTTKRIKRETISPSPKTPKSGNFFKRALSPLNGNNSSHSNNNTPKAHSALLASRQRPKSTISAVSSVSSRQVRALTSPLRPLTFDFGAERPRFDC